MTKSSKSHKEQNRFPLACLTAFYIFTCVTAVYGSVDWIYTIEMNQRITLGLIIPALGSIVSIFIVGQIDPIAKACLIFCRWIEPFPSGEAFSRWMTSDSRIDEAKIRLRHGLLPVSRASQNRLWYKMYKVVAEEDSVSDASKLYLLSRDATVVTLIVGALCCMVVLCLGDSLPAKAIYVIGCLIASGLAYRAARLAGYRLVKQVLIQYSNTPQSRTSYIIV